MARSPTSRRGARVVLAGVAGVVAAGLLTGAGMPPSAGPQAATAGGWGSAQKVAGLASHFTNTHWSAGISSLSCASPGNCSAGGSYQTVLGGGHQVNDAKAFVVSQTNGRWGTAVTVPGITALSKGGDAAVNSVSCSKYGCAAAGYYTDAGGHRQGFVVNQRHSRWQTAIELPGLAALNAGGSAQVNSVSCPSAGYCTGGGTFTDFRGHVQGFVVNQRNWTWRPALAVPGLAKMNVGGDAAVTSVRCAAVGNCAAGGAYESSTEGNPYTFGAIFQAFLVTEHNGVWSAALEVPGIGALNGGEDAGVNSISCPTSGNCTAGGYYTDNSGEPLRHPWVASEKSGHWGKVVDLAFGYPQVGIGPVSAVSCPSAGNCVVGGNSNSGGLSSNPAWVVSQSNGRWGKAVLVAGADPFDGGISSVSCPSVGNCGAGGYVNQPSGGKKPFLVTESRGHWGKPVQVPGMTALEPSGDGGVGPVSCPAVGKCTAAGNYDGPRELTSRPFVISQVK